MNKNHKNLFIAAGVCLALIIAIVLIFFFIFGGNTKENTGYFRLSGATVKTNVPHLELLVRDNGEALLRGDPVYASSNVSAETDYTIGIFCTEKSGEKYTLYSSYGKYRQGIVIGPANLTLPRGKLAEMTFTCEVNISGFTDTIVLEMRKIDLEFLS